MGGANDHWQLKLKEGQLIEEKRTEQKVAGTVRIADSNLNRTLHMWGNITLVCEYCQGPETTRHANYVAGSGVRKDVLTFFKKISTGLLKTDLRRNLGEPEGGSNAT